VEVSANFVELRGKEYCCSFARDITDRKQLEMRLRQGEKMEAIGQLAGGIAHDFNNQLMGIMGYADVLRVRAFDQPKLADLAGEIIESARRAADLTSQLLAFSRKGRYVSEDVDLHRLIGEVVGMLSHTIDKKIVMIQQLEAQAPVTTGDPSQLQSALLNLALNARDAMPLGGRLSFATTNVTFGETTPPNQSSPPLSGEYVCLSVSDTGEGIDPLILPRIFEPFFTTKGGKGTGLGLAAVYGTVESHKGTVSVRSEPGQGTVVEVHLPVTRVAPAVIAKRDSERESRLRSAHVLVVDDEPAVRDVTQRLLENQGCKVTTFQNGREALRFYEQSFRTADVVVLDMVMPIMDGRETFLAMRAVNPGIRALLASGHSVDEDAQAVLTGGARGFIQKPFEGSMLAKKIIEALETA